MYNSANHVHRNSHLVNPRKEDTIKEEAEKLLQYGFIYPIPLM
jgi:hypothetical protein